MFQKYPFIDINNNEYLITIEEFYKKGVPFISAKLHEVIDDTIDLTNGGIVEYRYSHSYKYYYEKPHAEFSSTNWGGELTEIHNEMIKR